MDGFDLSKLCLVDKLSPYPLIKSSWSFFFLQIRGDFFSEPDDPDDPEVMVVPPDEVCFLLPLSPARLRELFIMASRSRSILVISCWEFDQKTYPDWN